MSHLFYIWFDLFFKEILFLEICSPAILITHSLSFPLWNFVMHNLKFFPILNDNISFKEVDIPDKWVMEVLPALVVL